MMMAYLASDPVAEAGELVETLEVISNVIFGPEFDLEILEQEEDKVVMKITSCPMLNRARKLGRDEVALSHACQSYCRSVVESLKEGQTYRYTKRMCAGDPYCENVIERA